MENLFTLSNLLNLSLLTFLEIVLSIDNVIFIALLVQPLSSSDRVIVRVSGVSLALILRIIMLIYASHIASLVEPLIKIHDHVISGRDALFIAGGGFLVIKSTIELIELFKTKDPLENKDSFKSKLYIILQVIIVDLLLSFDSIITAVGISNNLPIIIIAILISMLVMLVSAKTIGEFIYKNQNIKIIALTFIMILGIFLVAAGFSIDIPKGYLYFALGFSILTEIIRILLSRKTNINHVDIDKIL